jgi:hypothetical protein
MRDLEYEREMERENERRRKKAEEIKKKKEREAKLRQIAEERRKIEAKKRQDAEKAIRDLAKKMEWKLKDFMFHPESFHIYKPGTNDIIKLDILENGTVRVDMRGRTISAANHPSSDAFFNNLADMLKGTWKTVARGLLLGGNQHAHAHEHNHAHGHHH